MDDFGIRYLAAEKSLREECNQMVEDGDLSQDDADFRFFMVRDEMLWDMEE